MVLDGALASPRDLARFRAEAVAVARLRHPNIVQVYEVGEHEGLPFFSLEYVEGGSLADQIRGVPLPVGQAAVLIEIVARAIHHAHEQGVVHRDLKPANILLASGKREPGSVGRKAPDRDTASGSSRPTLVDCVPKITDFGLAKQLDSSAVYTKTGAVVGTPSYMAPEQASGTIEALGPGTDIWALGAILYELLTGRPPFQGQTAFDTMILAANEDPLPPTRLNPAVPRNLEIICLKCLEKEPRKRYVTAQDLADDLHRFLEGNAIQARASGLGAAAIKWSRRHPVKAVLLGVSALAVLGVVAGLFIYQNRQYQQALSVREEQDKRRKTVRADIDRGWDMAATDPEQAKTILSQAVGLSRGQPGLDDVEAEATKKLAQIEQSIAARETRRGTEDRLKEFARLRDEALFHASLSTEEEDGRRHGEQTRAACRAALKLFEPSDNARSSFEPGSSLTKEEKTRLVSGCYELLLVLAEAEAQPRRAQRAEQERGQAQQALALLDRAAALGLPAHPTQAYHLRRARYLQQSGDAAAAERERAKAPPVPKTALDYYLVGDDHYRQGDLDGAAAAFEAGLSLDPGHFWSRYLLASCQLRRNQHEPAKAHLTAILGQRPDFVWALLLRAYACGQLKDIAAAEADFSKALSLGPDPGTRYVLHANRGLMRVRNGRLQDGIDDLETAVKLQPRQCEACVTLAQVYRESKKYDRALAMLDQAIERAPALAFLYRQRARLEAGELNRPDAALRDIDQAIRVDRTDSATADLALDFVEQGRIFSHGRRYADALAAYDRALAASGTHVPAHLGRAQALLQLQRYPEAATAFDRYLAEGGRARPEVYRSRGLARSRLGRYADAIEDYTVALRAEPDAATFRQRGWAYLASQAPRLARDDFASALKLEPASADAYSGRGTARVRLGEYPLGVADAEEAIRRDPASPRQLWRSARVYAQAVAQIDADLRGGNRSSLSLRSRYQDRALDLVARALETLPQAERAAFWHDHILVDAALAPLRHTSRYAQLEARYAGPRSRTSSPAGSR
jgi:tetratricopeptide (TPR) repeat protein